MTVLGRAHHGPERGDPAEALLGRLQFFRSLGTVVWQRLSSWFHGGHPPFLPALVTIRAGLPGYGIHVSRWHVRHRAGSHKLAGAGGVAIDIGDGHGDCAGPFRRGSHMWHCQAASFPCSRISMC
jgi:hypothetical protein